MKHNNDDDQTDEMNKDTTPGVVPRISIEQVKNWVRAAQRFSHQHGVRYNATMEHRFIIALASVELKCGIDEVRLIDLPPVVGMCISYGRSLTSIEEVNRD